MDNLITITEQNGSEAVSARELYQYLGYDKGQWSRWYQKNIIKNDFAFENVDYQTLDIMSNGNETKDFALNIDFATKISMMARTEKGEEIRKFFVSLKKQAISKPRTHLEVIQSEMALLMENVNLKIENDKMKPRSEFVDKVFNTDTLIDIGEVAKILNLPYGRNTLFSVLREKGIFFKNKNEPFQQYVTKGYFEVKEKFHEVSDTKGFLSVKTFATQKGLGFIAKILEVIDIPSNNIKIINA